MIRLPRGVMRLGWRAHRLVWDVSGGRLGRRAVGLPVLELITIGHRSGDYRSVLLGYVETSPGPVLAGTNAGAARDPAWVDNLRFNPEARVREAGQWRRVRARFLEGDEWDEAWNRFSARRGYSDYRETAGRTIPLVVLEAIS